MSAINLDDMTQYEMEALLISDNDELTREQETYLALRYRAMLARLSGRMRDAAKTEAAMEAIYATLPQSLRW